jgi:hypothetical protein
MALSQNAQRYQVLSPAQAAGFGDSNPVVWAQAFGKNTLRQPNYSCNNRVIDKITPKCAKLLILKGI